jgi:hypothetical protein
MLLSSLFGSMDNLLIVTVRKVARTYAKFIFKDEHYDSYTSVIQLLTEMSTRSIQECFWGVERGRCVGLTTLSPFVSRLSRQCGILNISQPYRPPRPVLQIALLYT